jgi:hypothetical protein
MLQMQSNERADMPAMRALHGSLPYFRHVFQGSGPEIARQVVFRVQPVVFAASA